MLRSVGRKKFNNHPFPYHQEIDLDISTLTNLGVGLGRVQLADSLGLGTCDSELPVANTGGRGWVVMVPFALPGERVRARIFRNHQNYSEADLVAVLTPSPQRLPSPRCPLFSRCGGCQYQHLAYGEQLAWKQRQVAELLRHMAGIDFPVAPVIGSPREFGYRSKITPHFSAPSRGKIVTEPIVPRSGSKENREIAEQREVAALPSFTEGPLLDLPIGFLKQGSRYEIVDVPRCEIATDAINTRLTEVRASVRARSLAGEFQRGATLLLRDAGGTVTTEYDTVITEEIAPAGLVQTAAPAAAGVLPQSAAPLRLKFLARDFFQNNPFILPSFAGYVRDQAAATGARFLIDAYCGSGLFALAAATGFERVAGIEVSETSVAFARENASANGIANASFVAGDAAAIFAGVDFPAAETVVVIDPPRKGCDEPFLRQLFSFGPHAVVYVSCDPATQMRDLRLFLAAGYVLTAVQPFDLFPQTRHLECVITLRKSG
jgi:23S rRNA (uracil1939-C5)-methyltransferase/tRNA (uracil-5-)-methyltransferase